MQIINYKVCLFHEDLLDIRSMNENIIMNLLKYLCVDNELFYDANEKENI